MPAARLRRGAQGRSGGTTGGGHSTTRTPAPPAPPHGGRQLDYAIASLDALPEVVQAVRGEVPVLLDGGIRRGTDVLKAHCLGASGVLIGRPYLYALAVGGAEGVRGMLALLREEIALSMSLLGVRRLSELGPDLLTRI